MTCENRLTIRGVPTRLGKFFFIELYKNRYIAKHHVHCKIGSHIGVVGGLFRVKTLYVLVHELPRTQNYLGMHMHYL